MSTMPDRAWGLVAEFADPETLLRAARGVRGAGYTRVDAYTPYPLPEVEEALQLARPRPVALITLLGGLVGAAGGYAMQYYLMAIDYPIDIGGRPLHSWPAFVPVTFELMVLVASLTVTVGLFLMNGLPRPHHPLFEIPAFARASSDRFFLAIEAADARFDLVGTRALLDRLNARSVAEVPDA